MCPACSAPTGRSRARSRPWRRTARVYVAWIDSTDDDSFKGAGEI